MKLNPSNWFVKWFFFCVAILPSNKDRAYYEEYGTNLCQFIRISLLWGPLCLATFLFIAFSILGLMSAHPGTALMVVLMCVGFLATILAIVGAYVWIRDRNENTKPGILRSWYRARKAQICPLIDFEEK